MEATITDKPAAKAGKAPPMERPRITVVADDMSLAEQKKNDWMMTVPSGTEPKDLDLQEHVFETVAHHLTRGDSIRFVTVDGRRFMDGIVVWRDGNRAMCRIASDVKVPAFAESAEDRVPEGFEIRIGIEQEGYEVLRLADGVILNKSFHIHKREEALRFLIDHPTLRGGQRANRPIYGS